MTPNIEKKNPLEVIGLDLSFFENINADSKSRHNLYLDVGRLLLRLHHPDGFRNRDLDEADLAQEQFKLFASARKQIEDIESFRALVSDIEEQNASWIQYETSQYSRAAQVLQNKSILWQQALQEIIKNILAETGCWHSKSREFKFLAPNFVVNQAMKLTRQQEARFNEIFAEAVEQEIDKLNKEIIEDIVQKQLLEDALCDLRIEIGLKRYIEKNPKLKRWSQDRLQDIDVDKYTHLADDITEKDLDFKSLYEQAAKIQRSTGRVVKGLTKQQELVLSQQISRKVNAESSFAQSQSSARQHASTLTINSAGKLSVNWQGQAIGKIKIDSNSKLIGVIPCDDANWLDENVLQPCGFAFNTRLDPSFSVSTEVASNLAFLGKTVRVKQSGYKPPIDMPIEECNLILEHLVSDLNDPRMKGLFSKKRSSAAGLPFYLVVANFNSGKLTLSLLGQVYAAYGV